MGKNYLLFLRISIHYFFFLTSLSACTSDCIFVLLWDMQCGFEHCSCPVLKNREMTHLNTGWFGGFSVWLTCPYRNDGTLKKHNTFGVQVTASLGVRGAFTQRFPGQSKVFSCLRTSGQGMKSVCGKEMRPLSEWINQRQVLGRNGIELILFLVNLLFGASDFLHCPGLCTIEPPWKVCVGTEILFLSIHHGNIAGGIKNRRYPHDHSTSSTTAAVLS